MSEQLHTDADLEVLTPEILPCLKKALYITAGNETCRGGIGCSYEVSAGVFGAINYERGACQQAINRQLLEAGTFEVPEFIL